ncbi:hypothetical protein Lalb_Chr06g0172801 [Lupinus albus]|uniref:Uncharacterized protein n=1 Tax=Lupinus albus TaxID=3870 RepID=A0A6A4QFL7_LUPAL|nr:hypothetical protein Lalb_Chr06g0172801 [Lupinus albus]
MLCASNGEKLWGLLSHYKYQKSHQESLLVYFQVMNQDVLPCYVLPKAVDPLLLHLSLFH